ncbi:MAG: hypothetical protein AAF846_11835 [Chloroflexota bacterium]
MSDAPVTVTKLPNGILEMRFAEISRRAVDAFLKATTEPEDPTVSHILVDSRIGIQPVRYTFAKLRTLFKDQPALQSREAPFFVACILDDTIFSSVAINFVKTLNLKNIYFQFFGKDGYDDAIEWLLSQGDLVSTNESATN